MSVCMSTAIRPIFMAMLGLAHIGVTDSYVNTCVKSSNVNLHSRLNRACGMYANNEPSHVHARNILRGVANVRSLPGYSRQHGLRSSASPTTAGSISLAARDELLITKPRTSHCWYGLYFDIEAKECAVEIQAIRSGSSRSEIDREGQIRR